MKAPEIDIYAFDGSYERSKLLTALDANELSLFVNNSWGDGDEDHHDLPIARCIAARLLRDKQ